MPRILGASVKAGVGAPFLAIRAELVIRVVRVSESDGTLWSVGLSLTEGSTLNTLLSVWIPSLSSYQFLLYIIYSKYLPGEFNLFVKYSVIFFTLGVYFFSKAVLSHI